MTNTLDVHRPVDRRSEQGRALITTARLADEAAERAFRRFIEGEVATSAAATRLTRKADEAWADVRLYVKHGELIEGGGWETLRDCEAREEQQERPG